MNLFQKVVTRPETPRTTRQGLRELLDSASASSMRSRQPCQRCNGSALPHLPAAGDGGGGSRRAAGGARGAADGEDYFIICTLGMGVILFAVMNNWMELTRGPLGIPGIPDVMFFGRDHGQVGVDAVGLCALRGGVLGGVGTSSESALGRMLVAISEDEIFCQSLGKNVDLAKLQSFVLGAMLAAVPGALLRAYVSFIDPTSFYHPRIHSSSFPSSSSAAWATCGAASRQPRFMILCRSAALCGTPSGIAANVRQMPLRCRVDSGHMANSFQDRQSAIPRALVTLADCLLAMLQTELAIPLTVIAYIKHSVSPDYNVGYHPCARRHPIG